MTARRTQRHEFVEGLGVTTFVLDGFEDGRSARDPNVPTVIIVPGAMDRAGGFVRCIHRLERPEVVAYDRRGYASSLGLTPSSHLGDHVDDLFAVIDDVGGPVCVVGHSQGALIALAAAARVSASDGPLRSVGAWEPPMPWFDWYDMDSSAAVHDVIRGDTPPEEVVERFMRQAISDRLWERLPASMRAERLAEGPALIADITASRRDDARVDLASITVPVVTGFGTHTSPQHRRAAEQVAAEVGGARLIQVDDATHGVHLTHPEAFAGFIDAAVDAAGH